MYPKDGHHYLTNPSKCFLGDDLEFYIRESVSLCIHRHENRRKKDETKIGKSGEDTGRDKGKTFWKGYSTPR